jgi:hypothetical protein
MPHDMSTPNLRCGVSAGDIAIRALSSAVAPLNKEKRYD